MDEQRFAWLYAQLLQITDQAVPGPRLGSGSDNAVFRHLIFLDATGLCDVGRIFRMISQLRTRFPDKPIRWHKRPACMAQVGEYLVSKAVPGDKDP